MIMKFAYALKSLILKPFVSVELGASWSDVRQDEDLIWVSSQRWDADVIAIRKALKIKDEHQLHTFIKGGLKGSDLASILIEKRAQSEPISLRPISVFWGRYSTQERSLVKRMFQEGWRLPGYFGRLLRVLVNIRSAYCISGKPIQIEILDELNEEQWLDQISEQLVASFRGDREAVIGPDYSHRRTLSEHVINDMRVQAEIGRQVEEGADRKQVIAKAQSYLNEMAADFSSSVIRVLEIILQWVWGRIYAGVETHGVHRLRSIAGSHEVVYVPCHRSHIDYLLLSYGIYREGLMPPHIAAGINLNMPVVGGILRKAGAFFIRRRIAGNKLYAQVLEAYLSEMIYKGYPIEYFIEGGRSRTGMLLQPKAGMLAMTLRSVEVKPGKPLAFVPVYFGYDKILESHSYIEEMYGKKKKTESVGQLFKALRILRYNYGSVQLNFGEPIFETDLPSADSPDDRERTSFLANLIMRSINSHAVLSSANLVATALLSPPKRAILESDLLQYIETLRSIAANYGEHVIDGEGNAEEILAKTEELGLVQRNSHELGDVLYLDQEGGAHSTFLRNNTLHLYVLPSLIARTVLQRGRISRVRLKRLVVTLYPYVAVELFLNWSQDEIGEVVDHYVDLLIERGLIHGGARDLKTPDHNTGLRSQLAFLSALSDGILDRFYLVAKILKAVEGQPLKQEMVAEYCVVAAKRMSLLHAFHQPDFFDKGLFRAFLNTLDDEGVIDYDGESVQIDNRLSIAMRQAWFMLSDDVIYAIDGTIEAIALTSQKTDSSA